MSASKMTGFSSEPSKTTAETETRDVENTRERDSATGHQWLGWETASSCPRAARACMSPLTFGTQTRSRLLVGVSSQALHHGLLELAGQRRSREEVPAQAV